MIRPVDGVFRVAEDYVVPGVALHVCAFVAFAYCFPLCSWQHASVTQLKFQEITIAEGVSGLFPQEATSLPLIAWT